MRPASPIHLRERDYFLELDQARWPPPPDTLKLPVGEGEGVAAREQDQTRAGAQSRWIAAPWQRKPEDPAAWGCLWRRLRKSFAGSGKETGLYESVIRFPSAPLSGIQQKPDFQFRLDQRHQHTFRLLTAGSPGTARIERIFLFLNGMNEIDYFDFYYDLAALLIDGNHHIACIVYPYPGHLSRYPMVGRYAEKPLQRFIMDPSDLFRQYLRFMIEMQWLLSVLVPVSYYPVAPGLPLLAEDREGQPSGGRCKAGLLSKAIVNEWQGINECSRRVIEGSKVAKDLKSRRNQGTEVSVEHVRHSVETIRRLIYWQPSVNRLAEIEPPGPMPPPTIHIVGYSLGAYLAQSAFFTWPFAISSCTSLCAGAALHELRPVKIAHEEEWRAITHGLKYEIDSGLLERRIRLENAEVPGRRSVCGIRASYFSSHFRIFTDVFLQDPHGSYRPRVSEFVPRLLFVVGGNDPIVSTKSVLDASPPEGINLMEIANLSHFIAVAGGEWPLFWLPTVAGVVASLAEHSEGLLARSVLSNLWNPETMGPATRWRSGKEARRSRAREPEPLDSGRLRKLLAELVEPLRGRQRAGHLFILRNQVPFTLMGERLLHKRGSTPHYEDFEIRRFWEELKERGDSMAIHRKRITIVVPGRLNEWFRAQPSILSAKSLPLARELQDRKSLGAIWKEFLNRWGGTGALYRFHPGDPTDPGQIVGTRFKLERLVRKDTSTPSNHPVVNCLPDVWMGLSASAVRGIGGGAVREDIHANFQRWVRDLYAEHSDQPERRPREKQFRDWLEKGTLKIIRVSAAQANPRYLGERIWDPETAIDLVVHSALALARSERCAKRGDFRKGWPPRQRAAGRRQPARGRKVKGAAQAGEKTRGPRRTRVG